MFSLNALLLLCSNAVDIEQVLVYRLPIHHIQSERNNIRMISRVYLFNFELGLDHSEVITDDLYHKMGRRLTF